MSIAGVRVLLSVTENQQLIITVKLSHLFTVIFWFHARKYININIYLRVYIRFLIKFKIRHSICKINPDNFVKMYRYLLLT